MALQLAYSMPSGCVPDTHRTITAGGDDLFAIRAVGRRVDPTIIVSTTTVSSEFVHLLTGGCVPDTNRLVGTGGDDEFSVSAVDR